MNAWLSEIHADMTRTGVGMTAAEVTRLYGKQPSGLTAAQMLSAGPFQRDEKGVYRAVAVTKPEPMSKDGPEVSTRALRASSVWGLA